MKTTLIFLSAFCLSFSLFAQKQQDVKFERNEVDEFTGDLIVETFAVNLAKGTGNNIWIGFVSKNGVFAIKGLCHLYSAFSITEGQKLYFKFQDGEILKTSAMKTTSCRANHEQYVIPFTTEMLYFDLGLIVKIANSSVVKVRVDTSDGYTENEVKPQASQLFSEYAQQFIKEAIKLSKQHKALDSLKLLNIKD